MPPEDENDQPTGFTGPRDRPPTADRMADVLQLWDTTTGHPRAHGDYLVLAVDLLALDEEEGPAE